MIDYDDDSLYETYEPQVGDMYAEGTVFSLRGVRGWYTMSDSKVTDPEIGRFIYRRPKPNKKEAPMSIPPRTERDALKAADESGAIKAWYSGKPVQVKTLHDTKAVWENYTREWPSFLCPTWEWRPAPVVPPKAVKLDYRPVSEPPLDGTAVLAWDGSAWCRRWWYAGAERGYTHWAPQPPAPEAE